MVHLNFVNGDHQSISLDRTSEFFMQWIKVVTFNTWPFFCWKDSYWDGPVRHWSPMRFRRYDKLNLITATQGHDDTWQASPLSFIICEPRNSAKRRAVVMATVFCDPTSVTLLTHWLLYRSLPASGTYSHSMRCSLSIHPALGSHLLLSASTIQCTNPCCTERPTNNLRRLQRIGSIHPMFRRAKTVRTLGFGRV